MKKLKVRWLRQEVEQIIDFEQAKSFMPSRSRYGSLVFVVEGRGIRCYEELLELAQENEFKDKEFLEMVVLMPIGGG